MTLVSEVCSTRDFSKGRLSGCRGAQYSGTAAAASKDPRYQIQRPCHQVSIQRVELADYQTYMYCQVTLRTRRAGSSQLFMNDIETPGDVASQSKEGVTLQVGVRTVLSVLTYWVLSQLSTSLLVPKRLSWYRTGVSSAVNPFPLRQPLLWFSLHSMFLLKTR